MRHSLTWRIAVPYALLILVVIAGLGLYGTNYLRQVYIQQTTDRLMAEARLASDALIPLVASAPDDPRINELAKHYASDVNGRVTVILPDGRVIGESELPLDQLENHLGRPEIQSALQNKPAAVIRYSATLHADLLYAAIPLAQAGKIVGVVRVAFSLAELNAGFNRLFGMISLAGAVAALAAILLAFWITGYTLRPLRSLASSVDQIRTGLQPELAPVEGKDEISSLQAAFNDLYQQMRLRFSELRAEQNKLEAVLMNMTDGIIIADIEAKVILINPAALRLFDAPQEKTGQTLVEVVRHHQIVELWKKCLASGEQQVATIELTGGRFNVQTIATQLGQEMDGAVLLVFQDLTRVRRLETVRRDFISNVSHELRTPLASLKALTETLQEGALEDPPAARRFLGQMETEIDNLTQMVRELLELSRIESGRVPLQRKPCDPSSLVAASMNRMRLQAERAGLAMELECPPGLPLVNADPERIDQVLVNLIHNAVKFTLPGGKIKAGAYVRASEVAFFVYDTGVGIQPQDLTRIFERFYKSDRSRSGGGTGLGLSIARHMIETHGGQIWAESTPGQGSTFTFTLPKA